MSMRPVAAASVSVVCILIAGALLIHGTHPGVDSWGWFLGLGVIIALAGLA